MSKLDDVQKLFISRETFVEFLRAWKLSARSSHPYDVVNTLWQKFYEERIVPLHSALEELAQPRPVESVEGELTFTEESLHNVIDQKIREEIQKGESVSNFLLGRLVAAIWPRIEAERAAWSNQIEQQKAVAKQMRKLLEEQGQIIDTLRAELATLKASFEEHKANSIPLPKWEDAPEPTAGFVGYFTRQPAGAYELSIEEGGFYIPRPVTEREMMPEEMAEAWIRKRSGEKQSDHFAKADLFDLLLSGKTIQQLMAEANLPTTKVDR